MLMNTVHSHRPGQRGLVLVLALIVLAAMSLAAIGLMRGVLGSNRVSGNLAYQQAAVQAADVGAETAIAWLEQLSTETVAGGSSTAPAVNANRLYANLRQSPGVAYNYVATRADPAASQSWDSFWQTLVTAGQVNSLPADSAGNTVSFAIHRLCANAGAPALSGCETSPVQSSSGRGQNNRLQPSGLGQVYYRITVRVQGPRNAASFIQTMVAI